MVSQERWRGGERRQREQEASVRLAGSQAWPGKVDPEDRLMSRSRPGGTHTAGNKGHMLWI